MIFGCIFCFFRPRSLDQPLFSSSFWFFLCLFFCFSRPAFGHSNWPLLTLTFAFCHTWPWGETCRVGHNGLYKYNHSGPSGFRVFLPHLAPNGRPKGRALWYYNQTWPPTQPPDRRADGSFLSQFRSDLDQTWCAQLQPQPIPNLNPTQTQLKCGPAQPQLVSSIYGQQSVMAALATPSPWSIFLSLSLRSSIFTNFGSTQEADLFYWQSYFDPIRRNIKRLACATWGGVCNV